jgi:hypothetical protein
MTPTFSISDALSMNNLETTEYDVFLAQFSDSSKDGSYAPAFQPYVSQVNPYVMGFLSSIVSDPGGYPLVVATYIQAGQLLAINPDLTVADAFKGLQEIAQAAAELLNKTGDHTPEGQALTDHARYIVSHASQAFRNAVAEPLTDIVMAVIMNKRDEALSHGVQFIASMIYAGWWMQTNRPPFAVTIN